MTKAASYLALNTRGILDKRIEALWKKLEACTLCPRECKVNRLKGEVGICGGKTNPHVASVGPHFGEEEPLVGFGGSGTIFFTHCNLRCIFCQNYTISHLQEGNEYNFHDIAQMMINLQKTGCHNINLVTPTQYVPQILKALKIAIELGLTLPLVYNCGGYESVEIIKQLEGIIDIYMPDAKFGSNEIAEKYTGAKGYVESMKLALLEMQRQVGVLEINNRDIAERGLLIRHLVMPDNIAGSEVVLKFIAEEISKDSFINIMSQYKPCYKANDYPELMKRISTQDMVRVLEMAKEFGLQRAFIYSSRYINNLLRVK
jgi:putative pyruvate formate lyase activating enzyme